MPDRRRNIVHCALAVLTAAAAATAVTVGAPAAEAGVDAQADALVVYDNNIENMLPTECADGYEFDRLIAYLKKQPESPDVLTVQQISDAEQLEALIRRLSDELPGTYAGRIAVPEPGSMGYDSPCGKLKNQQTNAVIFRTERLAPQQETDWRSDAPEKPEEGSGPCRNLEPTKTSQDRVHNIAVRLRDNVTGKDVTVASVHWPTGKWHGPECADENIKEADEAVGRLGGALKIVGGDTNAVTDDADWWDKGNSYGYRDPIAEKCGGPECPPEHNTTKNYRIDFLLAKGATGFSDVATLTDDMVGGKYSGHRAVTAHIGY
ncbi:hypothetical protein H181DRAFT_05091 [Streptomyces sp. WMMB 714]|uniref:endonuclease/exonuclease/phosphatase family protein n=1 Tax=Streptomyces sp. WMMB 714 TaxID=1286822 RepID=UPI0005F7C031|nr:endonuclease/exonuclease/phosphatase family protein [Streptomyces sp. WMMB 714]SCK55116.1 hypothetical protein H181DRAFT_05091 [Streptomyces sp. WMMB 714]